MRAHNVAQAQNAGDAISIKKNFFFWLDNPAKKIQQLNVEHLFDAFCPARMSVELILGNGTATAKVGFFLFFYRKQ